MLSYEYADRLRERFGDKIIVGQYLLSIEEFTERLMPFLDDIYDDGFLDGERSRDDDIRKSYEEGYEDGAAEAVQPPYGTYIRTP